MVKSNSFIATPPGATIKEQLLDRNMSQKEFAESMGMSEKHISRLINGEVQLTTDMALNLEMVLGIPASFWTKLEAIYREKLAKVNAENDMEEEKKLLVKFPYSEMVKNGWIAPAARAEDRVIILRKFFEVARLNIATNRGIVGIACRRTGMTEKADYALLSWAQKAKVEARSMETKPINIKKLIASIPEIRAMTVLDPSSFCSRLINLFAECGAALVFLPHIGGSFLHGATFMSGNKIVVGLTVRGKDADRFWFSLFHEIGHIVLGHIRQPDGTTDDDEAAADQFAGDALIPPEVFDAFSRGNDFSEAAVKSFAAHTGIASGIIVGRLQKEKRIPFNRLNYLKVKYELVGE